MFMCSEEMTKEEITRRTIIAKAAPLFNRLGYAGCSMQDIMAATGLEKGGLYRRLLWVNTGSPCALAATPM
jgi:AcrR family transcriptional regulator